MRNKTIYRFILLALLFGLLPALPLFAGAIPVGGNVQITDAGLAGEDAINPDIAVVGNTVYAVWEDDRDDGPYDVNGAIYFAKSTDGGATWGANKRITIPEYDAWADDPVIAVQPNGTIWIVWYQLYRDGSNKVNDIRLAYSTDGGDSFINTKILANGFDNGETLWRPDIAAGADHVHVLYRYYDCQSPCNSSSPDGYTIAMRTIDPETLNTTKVIVSDDPYSGRFTDGILDDGPAVDLTLRDGLLCAAWEDERSRFALYGACSQDNGQTFGSSFPITDADSVNPQIALGSDGTLYATYALDNDSSNNIWVRHSTDQGSTWSQPIQVTNLDSFEVEYWDFEVDANDQLLLAWVPESGFSSTDLYLSTSLDQGQNWSAVLVDDDQGEHPTISDHRYPSVVWSGSGQNVKAYLAWSDNRNPDDQIWFNQFILDGVPPSVPQNLTAESAASAIALSWQASTDATGIQGYRVYRADSAAGPFSEISSVIVNSISYVDVGLTAGVTYYYQVAAVDGTGNTGGRSNVASAAAGASSSSSTFGNIAYESGDDLRLRGIENGQERVVTGASDPRFSADGNTLFYSSGEGIWQQPTAGGNSQLFRQLGNPADNHFLTEFDVAANNQDVAAIESRQFVSVGPTVLCVVLEPHAYNSLGQRIFTDKFNYSEGLALSHDNRWMVYRYFGFCNAAAAGSTTPGDWCVVDMQTLEDSCLEGVDYRDADFAPGSNWVTFADETNGQFEIWKAQMLDNGTLTNYTQLTHGPQDAPSREPSWSSDGNWIVFQRDVDPGAGENWQLHVVRADGVDVQSLGVSGENPAWSGGGEASVPFALPIDFYLPLTTK